MEQGISREDIKKSISIEITEKFALNPKIKKRDFLK